MRAYEVPVRKNSNMMIGDIAMVPVQPFIEISFKNQTSRTTTAEGSNPTWNQDLHLTMRLGSLNDSIDYIFTFFMYNLTNICFYTTAY